MVGTGAGEGRFKGECVGITRTVVPVKQQEQELAPMAALAGALAAATEAGRYAGGGVRTVGQRVGRSRFGRGARQAAAESQRRAFLAYQALRGMEFPVQPPPRRRPVVYVVMGVAAGTAGAFMAEVLRRAAVNNADGEGLTGQVRGLAKATRRAATQAVPRRQAAPSQARHHPWLCRPTLRTISLLSILAASSS